MTRASVREYDAGLCSMCDAAAECAIAQMLNESEPNDVRAYAMARAMASTMNAFNPIPLDGRVVSEITERMVALNEHLVSAGIPSVYEEAYKCSIASSNSARMFMWLVRNERWDLISPEIVDEAIALIRHIENALPLDPAEKLLLALATDETGKDENIPNTFLGMN